VSPYEAAVTVMSCRTAGREAWPSAAGARPVLTARGAGEGADPAAEEPGSPGRPVGVPVPAPQPLASSAARASAAGPEHAADRGSLTVNRMPHARHRPGINPGSYGLLGSLRFG
jgi:hypothetical protein